MQSIFRTMDIIQDKGNTRLRFFNVNNSFLYLSFMFIFICLLIIVFFIVMQFIFYKIKP